MTSTGSGLSVPDWPLSYGTLFPPMIGGIRFEHSHRLIAAFVGFCTFGLTVWLWTSEKRPFMRVLAVTASIAVLVQAILGGITVKYLLPTSVSVAHACLGQSFFALLCLITLFLTREWKEVAVEQNEAAGTLFRLCCTTTAFAFAQLIAGAVARHTGGFGLLIHFFIAFFIVVHVFFLNYQMLREPSLTRSFLGQIALLDSFIVGQLFLGLGTYILKYLLEETVVPRVPEVLFATAHQTLGALILANLFVLCFRVRRLYKGVMRSSTEFLDLMKPRVTFAALATTLAGYLLAPQPSTSAARILNLLLGAFLIGGAGNALNQYFERDVDSRMKRTMKRPIPSGRLEASHAFWYGNIVAATGFLELFIFVSPGAAFVGALVFISYVFIYTPMKRVTPLNTYIGAIPGALPLLLGWIAGGGNAFSSEAVSLFMIVFLWQMPHFYAIAWAYKEDYRLGGLRMMPASDEKGVETASQILLFSLLLFVSSLLPFHIGLSGHRYLIIALFSGALFVAFAIFLLQKRLKSVKPFATASIVYLFVIIASLVLDKI